MELILPMYNAHLYFSLKTLGKKSAHYTWQNTVYVYIQCSPLENAQSFVVYKWPLALRNPVIKDQ